MNPEQTPESSQNNPFDIENPNPLNNTAAADADIRAAINPADFNSPDMPISPLVYGPLPLRLKLRLIFGGIFIALTAFFVGMVFTIWMQTTAFDDGPLNLLQKPILEASGIPSDAHRQWLNLSASIRLADQYFYQQDKINHKEMLWAAAQGAMAKLGDPYTGFVPPEQTKRNTELITGKIGGGIGVATVVSNSKLIISDVYEDNPAIAAGVQKDDQVVAVDGKTLTLGTDNKVNTDQINLLRGEAGSKVVLDIFRPSSSQNLKIEITRANIVVPSVRVKLLPDKVGYIQVTVFGEGTTDEFDRRVKKLLDDGATKLVLDLRDNPGGRVITAQQLLSRFIKSGVAYYINVPTDGNKTTPQNIIDNNGLKLYDIPLVVLVNKNSASASEITAGALQDRQRAELVGERTFGKGIAQSVIDLYDKSTARITFEKWLTPNKTDIGRVGIAPNIVTARTDQDIAAGRDPQLEQAVKVLSSK